MTVQPALDEPYFEMEGAEGWFAMLCQRTRPGVLVFPGGLPAPPGYSDLAEGRLKMDKGVKPFDSASVAWHHFLFPMGRQWPDCVLAVLLGLRSRVLMAGGRGAKSTVTSIWADISIAWRVWLYEHRQGQGWVCLDPRDDSHEAVRWLREQMMMEALK